MITMFMFCTISFDNEPSFKTVITQILALSNATITVGHYASKLNLTESLLKGCPLNTKFHRNPLSSFGDRTYRWADEDGTI
jgi:hypothetical protein